MIVGTVCRSSMWHVWASSHLTVRSENTARRYGGPGRSRVNSIPENAVTYGARRPNRPLLWAVKTARTLSCCRSRRSFACLFGQVKGQVKQFSQSKLAQSGAALLLMSFHPPEDVVESAQCLDDVRPFVEHHAFSTNACGCICDLRAGGHAFLCQRLEDLGRPDDRNVCRFTHPQDFFLNLRQPWIATFHSQIATRDHDANPGTAHSSQQERRQLLERFPGFNLQPGAYHLACRGGPANRGCRIPCARTNSQAGRPVWPRTPAL